MVNVVTRLLSRIQARRSVQALQSGTNISLVPMLEQKPGLTPKQRDEETLIQLRTHGFPRIMVEMFRKTADDMDSVIMSRAPGKATPDLIEAGHDLKGYQVKAKSCTWGPMSGFLCQITCLNKAGSAKIDYNDKNYYKYFSYIKKKQEAALKAADASDDSVKTKFVPFIPLRLFYKMYLQVMDTGNKSIVYKETIQSDTYGIAVHKDDDDATVYMEFLMRKTDPQVADKDAFWDIYHGRIFSYSSDAKKPKWRDFLDAKMSYMDDQSGKLKISNKKSLGGGRKLSALLAKMPTCLVENGRHERVEPDADVAKKLAAKLQAFGASSGNMGAHPGFFSLCVAQNPYPPYDPQPKRTSETVQQYTDYLAETKKHVHKNAVTGDYDLFAVWPKRKGYGWEELVRASDIQQKVEDVYKQKQSLLSRKERKEGFFYPAIGKPFGLTLKASPNVTIDVIPGFEEIEAWEDPEFGNAHNATLEAVQILNRFVFAHFEKVEKQARAAELSPEQPNPFHVTAPNVAFHSDEGGRPGIDEIDFPVGVFLPKSIAMNERVQRVLNPDYKEGDLCIHQFLLDKHDYDKFLALIIALRNDCFVTLNHVWMTYLFALVVKTPKSTGFFEPMEKDRKKLTDVRVANIRRLLAQLFMGASLRIKLPENSSAHWGMEENPRFPTEVDAANKAMMALAQSFVDAVAIKKADKKCKKIKSAKMIIPNRENPVETATAKDDTAIAALNSLADPLEKT